MYLCASTCTCEYRCCWRSEGNTGSPAAAATVLIQPMWNLRDELRFLSKNNKDPEPLSHRSGPIVVVLEMGKQITEFSKVLTCPVPSIGGGGWRRESKWVSKAPSMKDSNFEVLFVSLSMLWPCDPVLPFSLVVTRLFPPCWKGHNFTEAWWKLRSWTCKLCHYSFKGGSNSLLFHFPL